MTTKDSLKDTPEPDRPARAERPTEPVAPPVAEYPKMLYHADGRQLTVASKEEETKATAQGFQDTPVEPEAPSTTRRA